MCKLLYTLFTLLLIQHLLTRQGLYFGVIRAIMSEKNTDYIILRNITFQDKLEWHNLRACNLKQPSY